MPQIFLNLRNYSTRQCYIDALDIRCHRLLSFVIRVFSELNSIEPAEFIEFVEDCFLLV